MPDKKKETKKKQHKKKESKKKQPEERDDFKPVRTYTLPYKNGNKPVFASRFVSSKLNYNFDEVKNFMKKFYDSVKAKNDGRFTSIQIGYAFQNNEYKSSKMIDFDDDNFTVPDYRDLYDAADMGNIVAFNICLS